MAAQTPKLLSRELADKLAGHVEAVAQLIKAELPQLKRVGFFGSYLSDAPMIGDLDVAFELGALRPDQLKDFCKRHPSPSIKHVDRWPEAWTLRQFRALSILVDCNAWRILRPGTRVRLVSLDAGSSSSADVA